MGLLSNTIENEKYTNQINLIILLGEIQANIERIDQNKSIRTLQAFQTRQTNV